MHSSTPSATLPSSSPGTILGTLQRSELGLEPEGRMQTGGKTRQESRRVSATATGQSGNLARGENEKEKKKRGAGKGLAGSIIISLPICSTFPIAAGRACKPFIRPSDVPGPPPAPFSPSPSSSTTTTSLPLLHFVRALLRLRLYVALPAHTLYSPRAPAWCS